LDEKWSFVFKKRGRCSGKELEQEQVGDCWDHIAFDPEHRLVLGVIPGRRSQGHIHKLVQRAKKQLQGRVPRLISTDGFSGYAQVFQQVYGVMLQPPRPQGRKQPAPRRLLPPQLTHAMVQKVIEGGRVTEVKRQLAIGSQQNLKVALKGSSVSTKVNTAFVERHNATDRQRNASIELPDSAVGTGGVVDYQSKTLPDHVGRGDGPGPRRAGGRAPEDPRVRAALRRRLRRQGRIRGHVRERNARVACWKSQDQLPG